MLLLVFAIKIYRPFFFFIFFNYIQFTNINKCKAGTSISADTKCVRQIKIYIKIRVILEPFSSVLLTVFTIKNLSPVFLYIFFIINNKNVQQWSLKVIANSSFAHIFCIFSRVRIVCVQIGRTSYGRTLFSNFGLNV